MGIPAGQTNHQITRSTAITSLGKLRVPTSTDRMYEIATKFITQKAGWAEIQTGGSYSKETPAAT